MNVWGRRAKDNKKQAGQRGTCQHSQPSAHMDYSRSNNRHHMAGSKRVTHWLQNQEASR